MCTSAYAPLTDGMEWDYTSYDKKGKISAVSTQHVESLDDTKSGFEAVILHKTLNEKGEELSKGNYIIECKGDDIWMDLSNMLDANAMQAFTDMEISIENERMDIPNAPKVGQELADGSISIKAATGGMSLLNMKLRCFDRKVEKMEQLTTSAGTFDCVKITQQTEFKMIVKRTSTTATWYAKGVGMIRTESYDKKGQLESRTELTRLKR
jgi:hypothetical protein